MRKSIITVLGPTAPVHDLTTVDAVNAALGLVSNTANDAITAQQITAASRMIADECNAGPDRLRTFGLLEVEESFRVRFGEPVHALYLRQFPVEQITSVTLGGTAADATMYELDDEAGLLWMKCDSWISGTAIDRWWGEIVVNYSGGYDLPTDCPPSLAQACILCVAALRRLPKSAPHNPLIREVQHTDTRVMYFDAAVSGNAAGLMPQSALDLIDQYIRMTV
jgi:hypothetical protein